KPLTVIPQQPCAFLSILARTLVGNGRASAAPTIAVNLTLTGFSQVLIARFKFLNGALNFFSPRPAKAGIHAFVFFTISVQIALIAGQQLVRLGLLIGFGGV